jgi:ATP-binding cassette, subfamily C, bacterial CydC
MKDSSARGANQPDRAKLRTDAYVPAALTVLVWVLGAGLLGLSGWFIASSAVAGLSPASTFSWLFPSAGVQALAVARTMARYGERVTIHDVTLRRVASLRSRLFKRATQMDRGSMANLRTGEMLGRITVDSETVQNRLIRKALPMVGAAGAVIAAVVLFACVSWQLVIVSSIAFAVMGVILIPVARYQAGGPARRLVRARGAARHALI